MNYFTPGQYTIAYQGHLAVKKIPESIQKSTPYKVIPSAMKKWPNKRDCLP